MSAPSLPAPSLRFLPRLLLVRLLLAVALVTAATASANEPPGEERRADPTDKNSAADVSQERLEQLPGTTALMEADELIDRILTGSDRFLERRLSAAAQERHRRWEQRMQAPEAQRDAQLADLRERLEHIIGAGDPRARDPEPQVVMSLGSRPFLARIPGQLQVRQIRWPVLQGYVAEGLAVEPTSHPAKGTLILCPDADTQPEVLAGLVPSDDPARGLALQLAAAGCRVIVTQPITREVEARSGRAELTDREYVYRCTYVLGRHPLGLEVQSVRALVDWLRAAPQEQSEAQSSRTDNNGSDRLAVAGHGEGGLVALLTGALDTRVDAVWASGIWGNRDTMWREPISRNVFGFLSDFGDAPLACLVGPRPLVIEASRGPEHTITGSGAAPGRLVSPSRGEVQQAAARVRKITGAPCEWLKVIEAPRFGSPAACRELLAAMGLRDKAEASDGTSALADRETLCEKMAEGIERLPDAEARRERQLNQIEAITEDWVRTSRDGRREMIAQLNTESLQDYRHSTQPLRERLEQEVIGKFTQPLLEPAPRSRLWRREKNWTGWEVEMDVYPGVVAGGILLLPNDVSADQPRPVVVCVHGLEGTPVDTIAGDHRAYRDFAARLCERGFIVFCPQQLYRGGDRFRVLQRKANPLGKTLFSIMVPQHRQLLRWLKTLPQADPQRIGFYGLSYGGKSAMRIPTVVTGYGPTICSGDFNEWVLKNSSTRDRFSYVWTGEYEIFEFDLAGTFSYAEMAALICPRPFMIERGHGDGVAVDRWVAFEYAPVRRLYAARLGIGDRTEIDWFDGPHTINAEATFPFLHRHLDWPEPDPAPAKGTSYSPQK